MQLSSKKDLHSIRHNPKNSPDSYRTFEAPGNMDCDQSNLSEISARLPVIVTRVFSYLDGEQLAKAREVCKTWNKLATDEGLWKPLCVKNWKSLEVDERLWQCITRDIAQDSPTRWREMYRLIHDLPPWKARLHKNSKYVCNLVVHPIPDSDFLGGRPPQPQSSMIFESNYDIAHLPTFDIPVPQNVAVHFEPEQECDRDAFNDFIRYLRGKIRAEVPLERQRCFLMFHPEGPPSSTVVQYHCQSLFGFVGGYTPLSCPRWLLVQGEEGMGTIECQGQGQGTA